MNVMRSAIDAGLPRHTRWMVGDTPLDFDFAAERYDFRRLTDADVVGVPLPEEWSGCLIFGRYDYAEGGGASPWIAVRQEDGVVWALDIERSETMICFNSSLDRFVSTFRAFDQHLCLGRELPEGFANQVSDLDPEVFPSSDWRELIEMLTDVRSEGIARPVCEDRSPCGS